MSIGENIKFLREQNNFTQKELAEKVNVKQSMIAQLERGSKVLSVPLAEQIAIVFNCSIIDLISNKKEI